MQNCDAVKFYVDMIVVYRNSYRLTTNAFDIEHIEQTAELFFADMDMKTMQFMYSEILSRYP
jgi:hypothetical protein